MCVGVGGREVYVFVGNFFYNCGVVCFVWGKSACLYGKGVCLSAKCECLCGKDVCVYKEMIHVLEEGCVCGGGR